MMEAKKRPFRKSLRGKIAMLMLAVSLVPLALVGGLMYGSMLNAEDSANDSVDVSRDALQRNTIAKSMATQAWNLSVDSENWIAERINEVKDWAANTSVLEAARSGVDTGEQANAFLLEKVGTDPYFADAYIDNSSGRKIVQVDPWAESDATVDKDAWVIGWSKGLYVSDVYFAKKGGISAYYIDVAVLIQDRTSGDRLGVLVGSVVVHPIRFATEYGAKVPGSRVTIFSRDKRVIADSENPTRYMESNPTWDEVEDSVRIRITNDSKIIEPDYIITDELVAGFARAANDEEVTGVTIQFPDFDGLGWTVLIKQSADVALAPLDSLEELKSDLNDATNTMLYTLLGVLLGIIVLVPIAAYFLSNSIIRPVASLRDAAEKVSLGDMSATVEVDSDDEIGDLAESFDRMVMAVRFLSQEEEE